MSNTIKKTKKKNIKPYNSINYTYFMIFFGLVLNKNSRNHRISTQREIRIKLQKLTFKWPN
ncbi:hypothetical protein EFU27_00380 [Vibrio cholerae]|nr:hypothetical protein [Vibrio cholerae]EGR0753885.1 hypothetical protein [Vibrio cholerae]EGR0818456.1 hypothetical protein [Vibrio cholerae]EGR1098940.1 hypothetical protein [Vibrio cholerae]